MAQVFCMFGLMQLAAELDNPFRDSGFGFDKDQKFSPTGRLAQCITDQRIIYIFALWRYVLLIINKLI